MRHPTKSNPHPVNKNPGANVRKESSDERDPDAMRDELEREQWLRDNVPPHHG